MENRKKPHPIDVAVGLKIRTRRRLLRISQGDLGEKLGITFQQVQKYENGANRISASRLQVIADILNVPVSWFFEGLSEGGTKSPGGGFSGDAETDAFLATAEGLDFCRAISRIRSDPQRRALLKLVRTITEDDAAPSNEIVANDLASQQQSGRIEAQRLNVTA